MFQKILIANRGEIACRVIKTARRMGITTVAVYSQADARALHVRLADEAICIGPAPARESYLVGERVIAAALQSGAQAIHPGYGFLSENAGFAAACETAGKIFIGPPASAIRAMGSKSAAKSLMGTAQVPLTPGYHGENQQASFLATQAECIGYPVLIKAAAGGGGKGMRRVDRAADFSAALASCQREAAGAFGSDQVLIEKYILRPRHIEIQVFADTHGAVVSLFERDCSVQRRHQKVLEEAPAPDMTPARRAAMSLAACDAARAVGYVGAGTVEFIAQQDGTFYFMEMNTRLQVEHPVTEMITGLDLVEWQLRVASGEALPLTQAQISMRGHAIEARIYAEDPDKGFLPSTGRLIHLATPPESAELRIDTGVEQGDAISPHYDPMIAKLIVRGADRSAALAAMRQALARYRIVGVANNVEFLARLVSTRAFTEADLDTALIEREATALFAERGNVPEEVWLLTACAEIARESSAAADGPACAADHQSPWQQRDQWRLNGVAQRRMTFRCGEIMQDLLVDMAADGPGLTMNDRRVSTHTTLGEDGQLQVRVGDRSFHAFVVVEGERRHLFFAERLWTLALVDTLALAEDGQDDAGSGSLKAPMPGRIVAWLVEPGARVEKGAPILMMEAMKMEHTICAPHSGCVKAFCHAPADQVPEGAELVLFEAS